MFYLKYEPEVHASAAFYKGSNVMQLWSVKKECRELWMWLIAYKANQKQVDDKFIHFLKCFHYYRNKGNDLRFLLLLNIKVINYFSHTVLLLGVAIWVLPIAMGVEVICANSRPGPWNYLWASSICFSLPHLDIQFDKDWNNDLCSHTIEGTWAPA